MAGHFYLCSRLINTEPSELLRLWLSEPIAPESVVFDERGDQDKERKEADMTQNNELSGLDQ